jgi:hypothetical protein
MATGREMYGALREATRALGVGETFAVNAIDARDLAKLRPSDLVALGFDEQAADVASAAMLDGDFEPIARRMGLRLIISHEAPRLIPDSPAEPGAAADGPRR